MTGGPVQQVPTACTLDVAAGPARLARWRELDAIALLHHAREPGRLVATYRSGPTALAELRELVIAEEQCCGFVSWSLVEASDLHVVVSGTDEDLDALLAGLPG